MESYQKICVSAKIWRRHDLVRTSKAGKLVYGTAETYSYWDQLGTELDRSGDPFVGRAMGSLHRWPTFVGDFRQRY